jgi:UDP-glucose 4-epimerase
MSKMKKIEVKEEKIRCLVTGAAGFIGSHVTQMLLDRGYEVYGLDDLSTGKLENLKEHENFQFINGDIRNLSLLNIIGKCDYVFHLAAMAKVQRSIDDPVGSNFVNVTGTLNILEYCRRHKAKLIFSSSSSIYKGEDLPIAEIDAKDPKSPYGLQKLIGEQYIQLYGRLFNLDYCILRYFNVFGERQAIDGSYPAVVAVFMARHELGKTLTITNDGQQRRDFTYVGDVARANLMGMDWTGIYNIGSGKNYSVNEIAAIFGDEVENIGVRKGEARNTLADISQAKSRGWEPTVDVKDWVNEQISK